MRPKRAKACFMNLVSFITPKHSNMNVRHSLLPHLYLAPSATNSSDSQIARREKQLKILQKQLPAASKDTWRKQREKNLLLQHLPPSLKHRSPNFTRIKKQESAQPATARPLNRQPSRQAAPRCKN